MSIQVSLSTIIYTRECLYQAINAYSDFCSVRICHDVSGSIEIAISLLPNHSEQFNEHTVANEFLNYLLDLSLETHLQLA